MFMNNKTKFNHQISCENEYCIYQKNMHCTIAQVELDISGICQSCILVDIEPKTLDLAKQKQLERMQK